jgi:hypothetical protein
MKGSETMTVISKFRWLVRNPLEAIEIILALALAAVAVRTVVPTWWLETSVYQNNLVKLIVGVAELVPALMILGPAVFLPGDGYTRKVRLRKSALLWMTVTFTYMLVFRLLIIGASPLAALIGFIVPILIGLVMFFRLSIKCGT